MYNSAAFRVDCMCFNQQNITSIQAGTWAERWSVMKERHLRSVNITNEGDFWLDPDNVRRYLENTRGEYAKVVAEQLRIMNIQPGETVLDIGSGPGTLAVPLASQGARVTVVEPASLMCRALEEYRSQVQAPSINIITKCWEDVRIEDLQGPFDVIIASFSLTMTDIAGAIRMIQNVSSGRVYLFWFLTPPSWADMMQELWPSLHDKEYYPTPLADCLWNVLYEMGIYANLEVMDPAPPAVYDSIEQAVRSASKRLVCTEEWQHGVVQTYFRRNARQTPDGKFQAGGGHRSATIWWDNHRS